MTDSGNWRSTTAAARWLGVSDRYVRYLIEAGMLKARPVNPKAKRKTWMVWWPDVLRYDESRNLDAIA